MTTADRAKLYVIRTTDVYGVAVDGVVAIEGRSNGLPISMPVRHNAFYWSAPSTVLGAAIGHQLYARYADGRIVPVD